MIKILVIFADTVVLGLVGESVIGTVLASPI